MDDHAARLLVAGLALLALGAVAARRRLVAIVRAAAAATASAFALGKAGGGGQVADCPPPPAEPTPRPAWSAWACVPPGLRDDETGRILALAAVAIRAHAAGALVDLRAAVEKNLTPDDLVLSTLEELAAPWRAWPETKPPAAEAPSASTSPPASASGVAILDRPADGPAPAARGTRSHTPRNFGAAAVTNRPWKLVTLSRTYAIHDKAITELRMKEPTLDDYAELGEPVEVHTSPDGIRIATENLPALRAYIERCVDGIDPANLGMLGLPDARALRDALHSFFMPAATSRKPSTSSSSTPAGDPTTSAG